METGNAGVDMTDPAIISASYAAERNYSHNPDDVIDPSSAVLVIGTEKVDTTTLKDRSLNNDDATIHGPMPTEGFIQGRRYDGDGDYLDIPTPSITGSQDRTIIAYIKTDTISRDIVSWGTAGSGIESRLGITPGGELFFSVGGGNVIFTTVITDDKLNHVVITLNGTLTDDVKGYVNGVEDLRSSLISLTVNTANANGAIGRRDSTGDRYFNGLIYFVLIYNRALSADENKSIFNTFARLPFWSVNYTDYPNSVVEYTNNLPYSNSIINSGTFKVDDDVLNCVSAGMITYRASYEFDGNEYIKVKINGVEYAGTGTIIQGNTTVSVTQGSNEVTIQMDTGNTIDEINIQFREEV